VILDSRTVPSTPARAPRAGVDGHTRRTGAKPPAAVDPLGPLLARVVPPAHEPERAQVAALAARVQAGTGERVEGASVDQGSTGAAPAAAAAAHGIRREVVTLPAATRGFVLLPRRWVVERRFAWASRFRRLARDYERRPATLAGLHFLAFACLLLHRLVALLTASA
jgi:transposase